MIAYHVEPHRLHAHLYRVRLRLSSPVSGQILALPVWIPGSYLVREFAQHMQQVQAVCGGVWGERDIDVVQLDKHRWQVGHVPDDSTHVEVSALVYARDASVRTAWLDAQRGFFNSTSLCWRVVGREQEPHHIDIRPPTEATQPSGIPWQLVTGLTPLTVDAQGFGRYLARDYDELVDSPVTMGVHWQGTFEVRGIPHHFIVSGAPAAFDGERLLADVQRICQTEMAFWHGANGECGAPPFERYVFMLHATHDGYGGLEHHNSTALICPRADLPLRCADVGQHAPALSAKDGYTRLLGLISHEYFHTWNVKRLRPTELTHIDYDRENHTELLWFFEGFTSYFDDAVLWQAGLIDTATHLDLLTQQLRQVQQTPGRHVQTVAQASFDAWTRYYRVQENTPNATVSYYTKGALVALCLDLTLHQHGTHLAETLRRLWQRCAGGPMNEGDVRAVLREQVLAQYAGGDVAQAASHADQIDRALTAWIHRTEELPVLNLLSAHGIVVTHEAATLAQKLGLRVNEGMGLTIQQVLRDSLAEAAGLAAGDEWLAIQELPTTPAQPLWRIHKLADAQALLGDGERLVQIWVARDRHILSLTLKWPGAPAHTQCQLKPAPSDSPALPGRGRRWPDWAV